MSHPAQLTRRSVLGASLPLLSGCATAGRGTGGSDGTADAHLGFVGDVMLGRGVNRAHTDGDPAAVWGDVQPILDGLDGLLLNLECALSTRGQRTPDRGYYFRADPGWAVPALESANVAFVSNANNHVLDFGPVALEDTLAALDGAGIAHAGGGSNRAAAFAPAHVSVGGLDVAVLAVTDRAPAYAAGAVSPGTAYLPMAGDPLTRLTLSASIRAVDADLLVVSLHWGPNWQPTPAPRDRALARWLADAGADVVHGHSAHVPQGLEIHNGTPIIHDAGDFVDDYALVGDLHNDRSALFELAVADGRPTSVRIRPVVIEDASVHRASGEVADWIAATLRERSAAFGTAVERDGATLLCRL